MDPNHARYQTALRPELPKIARTRNGEQSPLSGRRTMIAGGCSVKHARRRAALKQRFAPVSVSATDHGGSRGLAAIDGTPQGGAYRSKPRPLESD